MAVRSSAKILLLSLMSATTVLAHAAICGAGTMVDLLAQDGGREDKVSINCDVSLQPMQTVIKTMLLEGSAATGATIQCHGASVGNIEIRSGRQVSLVNGATIFDPPERINIQNCHINGHIRITGMTTEDIIPASKQADFTQLARQNAPKHIWLNNVLITANKSWPLSIPLYISPGVSDVHLLNSTLKGSSSSVAIYLDAESTQNEIRANHIEVKTGREVIAIDGSSHNIIADNYFSGLSKGGIYLYRNCGERGAIRHATPSDNLINGNYFYYDHYWGEHPSIFVGARNGRASYCKPIVQANGQPYPFGSSLSPLDFAQRNQISNNRIRKRSAQTMIKVQNPAVNADNDIHGNQTVKD
jgi:hypothetical protein